MKLRALSAAAKLSTGIFLFSVCVMFFSLVMPGCKKTAVVKGKDAGNDILAFNIGKGQVGDAVFTQSGDSSIVLVYVLPTFNFVTAYPTVKLSPGASMTISTGSKLTFQGGSNPYTVLVTSKTGAQQTWYVKIIRLASDVIYKDPNATNFFNRTTGWIASDGGMTVPLSNGKVLWLFGDSYTNDYDVKTGTTPCLFNQRSTAMVQPFNDWKPQNTTSLVNNVTGALFRSNTASGYFNWPAEGVQIGDTVYVYCLNMMNSSGGLGFASGGNDVFAKMPISTMQVTRYHSLQDFNGITFGVGLFKNEADGYVYIYGNKQTFIASNVYVARFPIANPNANWTFWDGTTWNTDVTKISAIANCPSTSVVFGKIKDKYTLFTSEFSLGCDGGTHIYASVSSSPTGPFSASTAIYKITDTLQGHYPFFYLPTPHPEYINSNDELLLTYSINSYGTCVPTCVNGRFNPNYYRPRGIRIPLKLIDPSL